MGIPDKIFNCPNLFIPKTPLHKKTRLERDVLYLNIKARYHFPKNE